MKKNVEIALLYEIYGNVLTEKQKQIVNDYYNYDLSLSEIAENIGITRQAVRDNLKNAEKNLYDMEDKLELMKKQINLNNTIEKVIQEVSDLEISLVSNKKYDTKQRFLNIKSMLNNLKDWKE